jgi:vacuolar-type H+-ATPase subunit C/Vma6
MNRLVARARGLHGRLLGEPALVEIERASDPRTLAAALGRAHLPEDPSHDAIERLTRARVADDLAILSRWSERDELFAFELDDDRYSIRAIVRGLATAAPTERRRLATVATSRLPERALARLAQSRSVTELAHGLAELEHPLAPALDADADADAAIDVLALEHALARTYARVALEHVHDDAVGAYVAQTIDGENAGTALLLAARGGALSREDHFIAGGERLARDTFLAITSENVQDVLAAAFEGTPLARRLGEEAVLDWQLATQRALRRRDPHGLAAVIYVLLCRRREARRLRRAAWRLALGGAP